jgi:2-keto-4-pentenoate hydratase/2-oxohepta-3-ene-1,7-dioic acid hydratase in catechol pathway
VNDNLITLLERSPWLGLRPLGGAVPLEGASLLPPCEPSKIVCVGLNYRAHAAEMGKELPHEPLLFLKAPSALVEPGGSVVLPASSQQVEHEGELALVIGRTARHVAPGEALEFVLGYTCLDDVTARDIQRREKVYARAKGFDTFCPVGPWLETEVPAPQELEIELRVNGTVRQHGSTSDMIFPVADVVAFVSHIMTLYPGDLITTGTPPGVGPLAAGDRVEIEIGGIGVLRHGVASPGTAG